MKAKHLSDLVSLGSSLYMLSKDKELMEKLSTLAAEGKNKFDHIKESIEEEKLIEEFLEKARTARENFESKVAEVAEALYKKMNIAHTNELAALKKEVNDLRKIIEELNAKIK